MIPFMIDVQDKTSGKIFKTVVFAENSGSAEALGNMMFSNGKVITKPKQTTVNGV